MAEQLARFGLEDGGWAIVELNDVDPELRVASVGRSGRILDAGSNFEDALRSVARVANAAIAQFRESSPNEVEIQFGVRLSAEAGAVIASNSGEGHLHIKLAWHTSRGETAIDEATPY
jgi:Trypsin-co-occurring domain 1